LLLVSSKVKAQYIWENIAVCVHKGATKQTLKQSHRVQYLCTTPSSVYFNKSDLWGHCLCALSIVKNPINLFRNQNYLASHRTDILYCLVFEQSICGPHLETQNCLDRLCSSLTTISCLQACFNIFPGAHDRVFQWPFRGDATRDGLDTEGQRDDWEEMARIDYSHQALHYNQFRRIAGWSTLEFHYD